MKRPPRAARPADTPRQLFVSTSFSRAEHAYVRGAFDRRRKEDQLRALRELLRLAADGPYVKSGPGVK